MSNEITMKLKCSIDKFYNILESKGFEIVDRFTLNDTYFIPQDIDIYNSEFREILNKCILVRDITQYIPSEYKIAKLTYKIKNIAKNGDIISQNNIDCKIDNIEEGKNFLKAIGYKEIMIIKENDIVYEKNGFRIAVKDIENGDNLIEVETVKDNKDLDTIEKVKKQLNKLQLPLDTNDYFVKKAEIELKKYYRMVLSMSDINLNWYKVFCIVAESKNYKEAGEKLYLTESTISSHITNLEKKLDMVLFYRERDGLALTKAGKELYNSMHEKIKEMEFAENSIIQNNDILRAKITIGCPSHISIAYLSKHISDIRRDYPNLKVDIIGAADYNGLINLLQNHMVDFIIMDIIPSEAKNEIKVKELKKVSNIFISKEKIKIENVKQLEQYKFILNYENSTSTKKLFKDLKQYDVTIQADIQADITEMRIEEAKQGQGIGYVMKEAAEDAIRNKEVYEVDLPIKLPETNINLIYMEKYLTKINKIFIKKYLKD